MRITKAMIAVAIAAAFAGGTSAAQAQAATFIVTETTDTPDASVGAGGCDVDTGSAGNQCTLRAAIEESNGNGATADAINFAIPGGGAQTIQLTNANALPEVTFPVTIESDTPHVNQTRGGTMKKLTAIAAAATMAIGGSAGIAQARQGADDPAGHVRHGRGADDAKPHAKRAKHKHHGHHARHGADDGPNHT